MAPKGLYSVQKSRSFGGINRYRDSPPGDNQAEQGRRTPNLGSLRKKFSRKKATSFDEDDGDNVDGSSLKKKNKSKVGNILKWFKKDSSKDQSFESDNLTPKLTRVIQKPSEEPQKIIVSPLKQRSSSYDSICSVGSATSSFAFVPVNAYKVGRCVESKKRIAIGLNCGVDTYRARTDHNQDGLQYDKNVTLKTKYKLLPSESPPTLKKDENFSAVSGPELPSGPILPSHHPRQDNSDSDTDTVEWCSVSQRGSPALDAGQPQHPASPDQHSTADKYAGGSQPIKPRQLTGQLLHPMTIRLNDDSKKNALTDIGNELEDGTLRYFGARHVANLDRLSPESASASATKPESLPNIPTAEGQKVLHYPQSSNPFGDTASLAATLPIQRRGEVSPRSSLSGDDYRQLNHIPGKRKAPDPPGERPTSPSVNSDKPVTRTKDHSNPVVKKKGPAPQPPPDQKSHSLEPGTTSSASLAPFQSSSRPSSRQSEKIKSCTTSSNKQVMTGSAPTSPLLSKRFASAKPQEQKTEWVFEDGVLKSLRESRQDIPATVAEEKEQKEVKAAPLSPKPWYKRSIAKESCDKKSKDKGKDSNKKAKTPENLPEIHTSRESIRVKETFEEKYSYFIRMSKENLSEAPKSPKLFLRNKIMSTSPKAERPNSRPISGLTGISDLDRQAAEIIRRKNEDEAAKKKANDEKFYTDKEESEHAQQALDNIMDNVSKKMHCLDKIEKQKDKWDSFMDNNLKSNPSIIHNEVLVENERNNSNNNQNGNSLKVAVEKKDSHDPGKSNANKPVNNQSKNREPVTNCYKKIEIDISPNSPINLNQNGNKKNENEQEKVKKESNMEQDVQSMDNVVSDLNSFLASTRKAMSSPSAQKRLFSLPLPTNSAQVKEANIKRTAALSPTSNSLPVVKGGGTNNQYKENLTLFSPIIEQSETTSNSSVSSTPIFGGPFFKDQADKKTSSDIKKINNAQNRNSNSFQPVSSTEQKSNYFPPSLIPSSEYKSNLPPPPTQAPLPPLAVEKQDGWSCHRCTLINYNAQLWCEACGGKRLATNTQNDNPSNQISDNTAARLAINEQDLDNESEDAPPRVGNVLDKLVLFSAIDAKARETPTLQRRRSADINKLCRTYSTAMLPIEENPLQKTLDRISLKQAELAKPKDYFNSNSQRSSPKTVIQECSPQNLSEPVKATNTHKDIIKEQERLLEEASVNLRKQKQLEEQMELVEKTSTLNLKSVNLPSQASTQSEKGKSTYEDFDIRKEMKALTQKDPVIKKEALISTEIEKEILPRKEEDILKIAETPRAKDFDKANTKAPPSVEVKRASSFKGSFDFTKTPRAFLASKGTGSAPQWTKYVSDDNKVNTVTAPKLEFLGSEVTRKYSTPDTEQMRRARIDFFTPNDDNHTQNSKFVENVNTKVINNQLEIKVKKEENSVDDLSKPNINTIPKQRNSITNLNKQLNLAKINSVTNFSSSDPYYAQPVSPPRPVTPPRPKSPENFNPSNLNMKCVNQQNLIKNAQTMATPTENKQDSHPNVMQKNKSQSQQKTQPSLIHPPSQSPVISKPGRPKSPDIYSSDEETPPPRPASPVFQYPPPPGAITQGSANISKSVREKSRNASGQDKPMNSDEVRTPVNRKSMSYERDNLAELVTAHFAARNIDSRSCTPQGPPSGYSSRPYTPQSVIPQDIGHSHSRSRIPGDLSQSESKSKIPQEILKSESRSRIPVAVAQNKFFLGGSQPATPLLSKQNSFSNFAQYSSSNPTGRHSSYIDDSDYGAYQMSRDFVRTPSIIDERALSRLGSTSVISENDYSAFTPVATRKMSVSSISTPLATPKLNRDFGFVSSRKESVPKPPRRRSKDPGYDSRPHSRQINSSSRETTPVNNPLSPVRPSRMRGKNYPQQKQTKNCDNNKLSRPKSLQENTAEPLYEILTPPLNTFHAANRRNYSSSDSDSDNFRTPQASPKFMRPSAKNKNKNKNARKSSGIYEDIDVGQSYENFNDNPVLEKSKKISRMVTKHDKDYALPSKINKPKIIPPRTSQDPIPTPRKTSLTRSRNQSTESINRLNSLTRETYPKKEPHYKVPPPNPKLVNPNDHHFYTEPLYEEDLQTLNENKQRVPQTPNKVSNGHKKGNNQNIKSSNSSKSVKASGSEKYVRKVPDKQSTKADRQDKSRLDERNIKSLLNKQDQNFAPNLGSKQKIREACGDLEASTNIEIDTPVEVELSEAEDRFYDTKEEQGAVLIKKSKGIATLPDGSKYPCVIVQKKAKKDNKTEQQKTEKKIEEVPPKKTERKVKDYIPTEMKLKPDWFDDLKIKKDVSKTPRPTSIIDGVLYTSKALIDSDTKSKKLGTFNLIEPEVFEMYDVCKNKTIKEPQVKE